jgi:hypothetical protein
MHYSNISLEIQNLYILSGNELELYIKWFEGVVSVEGDNLVIFQYLSASEIWPD